MKSKSLNKIFNYSIYIVLALVLIVFTVSSDKFLTLKNVYSTLSNGIPLILIACAVTFPLLTGIIDLSVASSGYISGIIAGILIQKAGWPLALGFLVGVCAALVCGCINSLFIVKFKMNPMLVTLGMQMVIRSVGRILTDDRTIAIGAVKSIRQARIAELGGFPVILFGLIIVVVLCSLVLRFTPFGRKLLLVGSNERVAKNIGINTNTIKALALIIGAGVCGLAGCFWIITLGSVVTTGFAGMEFTAIAAAVLGGTSLLGGRGSFFPGAVIGAFVLLFVESGMKILGISIYAVPFVRGVIIFIAMYIDSLRSRSTMSSTAA